MPPLHARTGALRCPPHSTSNVTYYNSTLVLDDLAWGAAWLWRATGDASYLTSARSYLAAHYARETDNSTLTNDQVRPWAVCSRGRVRLSPA